VDYKSVSFFAVTAIVGLVVLAAFPSAAAPGKAKNSKEVTVDFNGFAPGKPPPGFSVGLTGGGGPPKWEVLEDPGATGGGRVLAQTSAEKTGYRFPVCVRDDFSARDVEISVRFKPVSGTEDQAAGLVFRYVDADNYYVVRANALEANVVPFKLQKGKRTDLKLKGGGRSSFGSEVEVPSGKWSQLKVRARGKRFEVFLNDKSLFEVEDATFTGPGKVGLWTKADSVTYFDDLKVVPLDNK
jgi:hypothetical protein